MHLSHHLIQCRFHKMPVTWRDRQVCHPLLSVHHTTVMKHILQWSWTNAHVIGLPQGSTCGPTRGIVKCMEQSWQFPPGVRSFCETKSPGQIFLAKKPCHILHWTCKQQFWAEDDFGDSVSLCPRSGQTGQFSWKQQQFIHAHVWVRTLELTDN